MSKAILAGAMASKVSSLAKASIKTADIADNISAEIDNLSGLHDQTMSQANHLVSVGEALKNSFLFLEEKRDGGFQEADVQAAERYIDKITSGDVASDSKKELRAIAVEARAVLKDETLRAVFKSKVETVVRELQADMDSQREHLDGSYNLSSVNRIGSIEGERSADESYAQSREVFMNVLSAAEILLSKKRLDLTPISVGFAMQNARCEISQREGRQHYQYSANNEHAVALMQRLATEAKAEAKLAM